MPIDFTLPAPLEAFRPVACAGRAATGWLAAVLVLLCGGPLRAWNFNGGDDGTGAKFSLIDPAALGGRVRGQPGPHSGTRRATQHLPPAAQQDLILQRVFPLDGGRSSNNEVTSAQTAYNEYAMPELVAVENGIAVSDANPWLPTVRTSDGHSARFTVRGGRELLAIAAEGFTSYRPPALFRIDGGQRTQIQYSVNGHDGVTTYLDASNTVGFSIPVDMTPGQQSTFEFVQGAGGFSGFDGGTLEGWTDLTPSNNNTGPRHWALSPPALPNSTHSGAGAVGQQIVGGTQDSSHPTLVLRSPEFQLSGSGGLTAWLRGGTGSGSLAGTAVAALPTSSTNPGFLGIALRNIGTGTYQLSARRSSSGDDWQLISFTAGQLAALDPQATYTLDLIDQAHGGWGWVAMDSVSIPGTPPPPPADPYADWAATMGLAGAAAGFLADPDHDGIANGIEFVLGGQPNPALADAASQHLLPTGALDGEHFVFTYRRSHAAAYLGPLVEFASDLSGPWTAAVDGVNATITAALIPGAGADMVTVAIPAAGLPRLFARLKVAAP
jgi:hypothetical protein